MTEISFDPTHYDNKFVADLVAFVSDDKFQILFEGFFVDNALTFSYDDEHKLEYTACYQKFSSLFENQLIEFCLSKNISEGDFVKKCREVSTTDMKTRNYIDILLSSVDYETFVTLMKIMRPVAEMRKLEQEYQITTSTEAEPKSNKVATSEKTNKAFQDLSDNQVEVKNEKDDLVDTSPKSSRSTEKTRAISSKFADDK